MALGLISLVLAIGPGNLPAVWVWTVKTVQFGSKPIQNPDPRHLGRPNTDPYLSTRGVWQVWLDPLVPISDSSFQLFYLSSHSEIILLITKYCLWYVIVLSWCICRLYNQKQERDTPCAILKSRVNGTSTIFGLASGVIWVAIGCRHS